MRYSKTISYMRNGRRITYTREYNAKYGRNVKIVKTKGGKSYAYRTYKVNGKTVRRRIKNIMKNGKITKYGQEWLDEYKRGLDLEDRNDLQARLLSWHRQGETITAEKIKSVLKDTKVERYLYNMGGEPDDIADEIGIDRSEFFNADNWDFRESIFTFDGETYEFSFDYSTHNISWRKQ